MKVPNFEGRPHFLQQLGLAICGFVIGCAVMTALSQGTVQELQYEIDDVRKENKALADQVASFEKVKNQRNVIDRTSVRWDPVQKDIGKAALSGLEERIGADLLKLVGHSVRPEMYEIYRGLVDGKVYYDVNGKNYRVRLTVMSVIGSEFIVFVTAEEFIEN